MKESNGKLAIFCCQAANSSTAPPPALLLHRASSNAPPPHKKVLESPPEMRGHAPLTSPPRFLTLLRREMITGLDPDYD